MFADKIEPKPRQSILLKSLKKIRPTSLTIYQTETISMHARITGLKSLLID